MNEELLARIEKETGFNAYDYTGGNQLIFYGTSDTLDVFESLVEKKVDTGTVAVCIDTGDSYMYSLFKNTWYKS